MSENKKYYWLKLKNDFFNQKEIKKLRSIAGGDTYTIIYLKLQLLSLCREGRLVYEGVEENFISEMALEIDEKIDDVGITISFLEKHGLLESSEEKDEYILPEAMNCMGKITSEGIRKSKYRERVGHRPVPVPLLSVSVPPEIEIEKEIDIIPQKKEQIKDELLFNMFWKQYDKQTGKQNTIKHWNKLTQEERIKAEMSVVNYLKDRPDKKYRKDPERYIRDKVFMDYLVIAQKKFKDYV